MLNEIAVLANENQGFLALVTILVAILVPFLKPAFTRFNETFRYPSLKCILTVESTKKAYGRQVDSEDLEEITLTYKKSNNNSIVPSLSYLDAVREGKYIHSISYQNSPFILSAPTIILDILNTGSAPILIKGFQVNIKSSNPINEAIPVFDNRHCEALELNLINQGFSPMHDVQIKFTISSNPDSSNEPLSYEMHADEIIKSKAFDLKPLLVPLGIDVDYFEDEVMIDYYGAKMQHSFCEDAELRGQIRSEFDNRVQKALGSFPRPSGRFLFVHGILSFKSASNKPNTPHVTIPFSAEVPMYMKAFAGPSLEAKYSAKLQSKGSNYTINIGDIHLLQGNSGNRFTFTLGADASSKHLIEIYVVTEKGKQRLMKKTNIELLIPRTWSEDNSNRKSSSSLI